MSFFFSMANGHFRSMIMGKMMLLPMRILKISPYVSLILIGGSLGVRTQVPVLVSSQNLISSLRWWHGSFSGHLGPDVFGDTGIAPTILWHVNRGEWWSRSTQKSRINDLSINGYLIYPETQHALMDDQMTRFCTQIPPLAEIQLWVCPPPSCVHLEHLWNTCGTLGYLDIPLKVTGREAVQWRHVCYWYSFGVIIWGSLKHPIHGSFTERIARAAIDLLDNQDAIKKQ